jgi:predicted DsbA family dithiol-disulfide isomerase
MSQLPTIHIWSDIACPFCMIEKKRLFDALPENSNVVWHSFILQPDQITDPDITLLQFLANSKGWSLEQTAQIQAQVTAMAKADGIEMNMDKVIPANTKRAHQLIQLHKDLPSVNAVVSKLFDAYFRDGLNIDDLDVLQHIHIQAGGKTDAFDRLNHPEIILQVQQDIQQANQMGVRGVPFFYFEDHFTISGAREQEVFRQAIAQFSGSGQSHQA